MNFVQNPFCMMNTFVCNPFNSFFSGFFAPAITFPVSFGNLCTQPYFTGNQSFSTNMFNNISNNSVFGVNPFVGNINNYVNTLFKSVTPCKLSSETSQGAVASVGRNTSYGGTKLSKNSNKYGKAFLDKVKQIAKNINCDYRDLLAVMNSESGINASQWCKISGEENKAVGLIQFRSSTAKMLGTTLTALSQMSPIEQLDYVEKYFKHWISVKGLTGKKLSAGDIYALVYTPAYVNKDVLASSGDKFYNKNKGLDVNKDGKITKSDLAQQLRKKDVSESSFLA
jgi:hypothetical protein